jgi:putative DNA primase/helicase
MFDKLNSQINKSNKRIYLKTKNKVRVNAETYSFDEAKDLNQIAWLVHDDYVVIDVDIKKHANRLYKIIKGEGIKCHVFRSRKGAHFVFREREGFPIPQVVNQYGAVGLKYDTRTTGKGYIVLPYKQDDRKWINVCEGKIDELPMWLYPQKKFTNLYKDTIIDEESNKKKKVDIMPDFAELGEGDGRNDILFRYFTNLLKYGDKLTIKQKRESVRLLNKYVLGKPLTESELESTVVREELTEDLEEDSVDHGQELDPDIIANKMINHDDIITKNDIMYIYEDGYYKPLSDNELHYLIHHKYDKRAKDFKRNEIVKFVKVKTDIRDNEVNTEPMMINVPNGRINLIEKKLDEHVDTSYDTIRIPYKYNPEANPSDTLKKFLKFVADGNKKKLDLVFEMIGLTLIKRYIMEVFFVLVGEKGANGKSTLLEIIENLLGSENVSNIDLGEISSDDYAAYELYGKLANIGDDLKLTALKDTGLIKTLTSGKSINAKVKFKPRFKFRSFATQIYAANRIPITYDKTGGFMRRFVIIRFDKSVPVHERDPFLIDKLTREDYEYLLKRGVSAASKIITTNQLTELEESKEELQRYKEENSSVLIFLKENSINMKSIDLYPVRELYASYKDYCFEGGYKPLQKSIFDQEIHQQFNVDKKTTTKNGKANMTRWVVKND